LIVNVTDDDGMLEGDKVLLRRVIDNLLENAHKYTDEGGAPIDLTMSRAGHAVVIEVKDHGIGIGASDLPNVFRPFFRADKSRTRATGGLGLGLALAKRIVDAHGGSLELESREGEGTLARVTLPLREPKAASSTGSS
jgi:signal transduction histidine kinase